MSNNINDVVDVTIAIESPATDSASFSNLLLVVPKPTNAGDEEMNGVIVVQSAKDLTVFGYTSDDAAYKAVAVAFNQDMRPDEIYVIAREKTLEADETIADCLDRAVSVNKWYGFALVSYTTSSDLEAAAKWAEANGKLFGFTFTSGNCLLICHPITIHLDFLQETLKTQLFLTVIHMRQLRIWQNAFPTPLDPRLGPSRHSEE